MIQLADLAVLKGLTIAHINICSIRYKLFEVERILFTGNIDILGISETKALSPLELRMDVDTHRCWSILQNTVYFTVFEITHIWLTNGCLTLMDAHRHAKSSSTTAKN